MYVPVTFKISEDSKIAGEPAASQVYTTPSSFTVTSLTTIPITVVTENSNMWFGVFCEISAPSCLNLALSSADTLLAVTITSQCKVTASPTHGLDGMATSGCWKAVREAIVTFLYAYKQCSMYVY